jgi:hypothetical protein
MSESAALEGLLGELARKTGVERLALDKDGVCAIEVDGRFVLHVAAGDAPDEAMLYVRLGDIREDQQLAFYRRMLEANAGGTSLALDEATGAALLVRRTRLEGMGYPAFERLIEDTTAAAEGWIKEFETALGVAPTSRRAGPNQFGSFMDYGIRA